MQILLSLLSLWNWITNLYTWTTVVFKKSVKGIVDAQKEDLYVFLDDSLPLLAHESLESAVCVYTPSTKTFSFGGTRKYRFSVLSVQLVGSTTVDLTEFFMEASWTGSEKGPTASQAVIAAMLDQGVPLTMKTLSAYHLVVEDENGVHKLTDFSQRLPG